MKTVFLILFGLFMLLLIWLIPKSVDVGQIPEMAIGPIITAFLLSGFGIIILSTMRFLK